MAVDRDQVARWLAEYVEAWKRYDRDAIGALFADDAEYRWHPYDEPVRGREAIVEGWFEDPDEPGTYDASYEPVAVDEDVAVATGTSTYYAADGSVEKIYDNCFLIRFAADGRCREFTEWFMERPERTGA
jgi:ketosteroid isomerase-like protein